MKILLVQTANKNLGDSVLADNNAWLIRQILGSRAEIFRYSIVTEDISQVKYVDAVIFAGGILKITNEKFFHYIPDIIEEAQTYHIPVFMSAVGVENCDPDSPLTQRLKAAVNLPCVKGISIRDDIETFRSTLQTREDLRVMPVCDPAVWTRKCYNISKKRKSSVIGLGITRYKLFADYGYPEMTKEKQIAFWTDVVRELENRGYEWQFFTNGDRHDELFAEELLEIIGHGTKLPCPVDSRAMIEVIASFRGLIAGRMHSNIVAYALGIPSIGFVWNQKLRFWSQKIRHPERFMEVSDIEGKKAVDLLQGALGRINHVPGRKICNPVKAELAYFLSHVEPQSSTKSEKIDYGEKVLAPALGGIQYRYKNTNCMEAFTESLKSGYKWFCLHLRMTSDGHLVCVQAWDKDTLQIMEKTSEPSMPLSYKEFMESKYYQRFATMDLNQFLTALAAVGQENHIILSIGKPDTSTFTSVMEQIHGSIEEHGLQESDFYIRINSLDQLKLYKTFSYTMKPLYFLTNPKKKGEEQRKALLAQIHGAKEAGIDTIGMVPETAEKSCLKLLKEEGMQYYIDAYTSVGKVVNAIHDGAWLVGSRYYTVDYLDKLTN